MQVREEEEHLEMPLVKLGVVDAVITENTGDWTGHPGTQALKHAVVQFIGGQFSTTLPTRAKTTIAHTLECSLK